MSFFQCRHSPPASPVARHAPESLRVSRCRRHSQDDAGVSVWVWGANGGPGIGCVCMVADRFLVVTEGAAGRWRQSADVVVGCPQPSVGSAVGAAEAGMARVPGCALVAVPATGAGTVFRSCAEQVLLRHGPGRPEVCGVCIYPWLAAGYQLTYLMESLGVAVETPSW